MNSKTMACPIDGTTLVMTERQGIEIDYCPACRGVWLDRGELDKILERNAEQMAPPPQAPPPQQPQQPHQPPGAWTDRGPQRGYDRGYDDDYRRYGHKKRRKSFLEELFD